MGLLEHHPELFEAAKQYEKIDPQTGERYTWNQRESLDELAAPAPNPRDRGEAPKSDGPATKQRRANLPLLEVLNEVLDDENDDQPCHFCHTEREPDAGHLFDQQLDHVPPSVRANPQERQHVRREHPAGRATASLSPEFLGVFYSY